MFRALKDDIVRTYHRGNMVTQLIFLNIGVFVVLLLSKTILQGFDIGFFDKVVHVLSISSEWKHIFLHPWSFITANFMHLGFFHLLFNMMGLYVFGVIVGDLIGDRHVLPIYILGGIVAGFAFFLSALVMPFGQNGTVYALGASGGVMAIAAAAATLAPEFKISLMLFGRVQLKYVVLALVVLDLVGLGKNINTGGSIAHIGGLLFGFLYIYSIRNGQDIGAPFNTAINNIRSVFVFKRKPKSTLTYSKRSPKPKKKSHLTVVKTATKKIKRQPIIEVEGMDKATFQEHLDAILDKIKATGYDSLTREEKEFLFKASNR